MSLHFPYPHKFTYFSKTFHFLICEYCIRHLQKSIYSCIIIRRFLWFPPYYIFGACGGFLSAVSFLIFNFACFYWFYSINPAVFLMSSHQITIFSFAFWIKNRNIFLKCLHFSQFYGIIMLQTVKAVWYFFFHLLRAVSVCMHTGCLYFKLPIKETQSFFQ